MVERIITDVTTRIDRRAGAFSVQVTTRYCESAINGGRIQERVERYEDLMPDELTDVLDSITEGQMPGESLDVEEARLFVLA